MSLSLDFSAWWLCVNSLLNIVFGSYSINHHDNPIHRQNRSQISRQTAVKQCVTCSQCEAQSSVCLVHLCSFFSFSLQIENIASLDLNGREGTVMLFSSFLLRKK